jgi:ribosomal-protein-alanine N-acetyltransferase
MNIFGKISNFDSEPLQQTINLDSEEMDYPWRKRDWVDLDWNIHQLFSISHDYQVLGFALFHHVNGDETAHLLKICMTEKCRGTGLAKELFDQSFLELQTRGVSSIYLEVQEGNARAICFYHKLGFKLLRPIQGYYSDGKNALTMLLTP